MYLKNISLRMIARNNVAASTVRTTQIQYIKKKKYIHIELCIAFQFTPCNCLLLNSHGLHGIQVHAQKHTRTHTKHITARLYVHITPIYVCSPYNRLLNKSSYCVKQSGLHEHKIYIRESRRTLFTNASIIARRQTERREHSGTDIHSPNPSLDQTTKRKTAVHSLATSSEALRLTASPR